MGDDAVTVEDSMNRERILESFHNALQQWVCHQNEQPLTRWLARELDSRGTLARLAVSDWHFCLDALREARRSQGRLPAKWDESVARLIIAALRFSRPDGSPAGEFDASRAYTPPEQTLRQWLAAVEGTDTARYPRVAGRPEARLNFAPELPAWEVSRGVLSVLRDEVKGNGDFLAVDHRVSGTACRFELFGAGRSWLGPSWSIDGEDAGPATRPKPGSRISVSGTEIAEWSYRLKAARITQTVLLLGGRRLALLLGLFRGSNCASTRAWAFAWQFLRRSRPRRSKIAAVFG